MIHREDIDGAIFFRNDEGQLHNVYGPAVIDKKQGFLGWFYNGKRHRTNGPAIEFSRIETISYWIHGIVLNDEHFQWCRDNNIDRDNFSDEDVLLFVMKFGHESFI